MNTHYPLAYSSTGLVQCPVLHTLIGSMSEYMNEIYLRVCVHIHVCMSKCLYIFAHVHLEDRGWVSSITDSFTEPGVLSSD